MFQNQKTITDPRAIKQMIAQETAGAVPVRSAETGIRLLPNDTMEPRPTVCVDARNFPAVRDLLRVHKFDGPGDTITEWHYITSLEGINLAILRVRFKSPVKCFLKLVFRIREDFDFLSATAKVGMIYLETTHMRESMSIVENVAIEVNTEDLSVMLLRFARCGGTNRQDRAN